MKPKAGPTPRADTNSSAPRRQRVQAAETGISILKGLAALGGRASLTALSQHLQEPGAKLHRYLMSMVDTGFVAQDSVSHHYYLGVEAIRVGVAAMRQADAIRMAEPVLVQLRQTLGVTCFIAVMGNKGPTIIRFEEPPLPVTVNVRIGSVLPLLLSATGRAFLAHAGDAALLALAEQEWQTLTPGQRKALRPHTSAASLQQALAQAACISVADTNLPGISAVAAPVRDYQGKVVAVITALGATGGFDACAKGPIARAIVQQANAVSLALGFEPQLGGCR